MRVIGVRQIPERIAIKGDKGVGMGMIGYARKLLTRLEESMIRSPLKLNLGNKTHYEPDGSIIQCIVHRNLHGAPVYYGINITTPGYKEDSEVGEEECFCNCDFAQGVIISASANTPDYPDTNRRYDVQVCNGKDRYVLYYYCLPSDFYDYETEAIKAGYSGVEGMPVVVFLDNNRPKEDYSCCSSEGSPTEKACSPNAQGGVATGEEIPVYRIVPLILDSNPRWTEVE